MGKSLKFNDDIYKPTEWHIKAITNCRQGMGDGNRYIGIVYKVNSYPYHFIKRYRIVVYYRYLRGEFRGHVSENPDFGRL